MKKTYRIALAVGAGCALAVLALPVIRSKSSNAEKKIPGFRRDIPLPSQNRAAFEQKEWIPKSIGAISAKTPNGAFASGSAILFNNGVKLETDLVEIDYIGQLPAGGAPFLILSARGCDQCDMNTSIYILKPTREAFKDAGSGARYTYPGELTAIGAGDETVSESRFFWGKCLADQNEAALWFARDKTGSGGWENSVYAVSVVNGELAGKAFSRPLPSIEDTLKLAEKGLCLELPGTIGSEEP